MYEPPFRLVLARDKRDRLATRINAMVPPCACSARGCDERGIPVLLVESETEAVLCPRHALIGLDGEPVEGEPMLAMPAW